MEEAAQGVGLAKFQCLIIYGVMSGLILSGCNLTHDLEERVNRITTPQSTPAPTVAPSVAPTTTPAPTVAAGTPNFYLSPTGDDVNGNGTSAKPFKSLKRLWQVIMPGEYACLKGGEYLLEEQQCLYGKSGTASKMIKIWACPGEKPVLKPKDASYYTKLCDRSDYNYPGSWRLGMVFKGNYVHFKGIELTGFKEDALKRVMNPLTVTCSKFNIFEELNVHHNGGGMYIHGNLDGSCSVAADGLADRSEGNQIINSDFHHNYDTANNGGNADGVAAGYNSAGGAATLFRGNRSWHNGDDGFDVWMNESSAVFENNWAWHNGYKPDNFESAGNGNGFKLGLTEIVSAAVLRTLRNNLAFKNREHGFDKNGAQCRMEFTNNTSYGNLADGFQMNNPQANIFKYNISYQNGRNQVVLNSDRVSQFNAAEGVGLVDNWARIVSDSDFVATDFTGVDGPRNSDGSLPSLKFLKIAPGSDLVGVGAQ